MIALVLLRDHRLPKSRSLTVDSLFIEGEAISREEPRLNPYPPSLARCCCCCPAVLPV
jgi:hypothetical protein